MRGPLWIEPGAGHFLPCTLRARRSSKPPAAPKTEALRVSRSPCPHLGQEVKKSPGIKASLRGATVLDQWQEGQVYVIGC